MNNKEIIVIYILIKMSASLLKPLISPHAVIGTYFECQISYKSNQLGQVIIPFPKLEILRITKNYVWLFH